MPGKIGDALYTLPTIHTICERDDAIADFYTSEMCRPLERLFRYQDHINNFIIPPEYKIDNEGCGVQPWQMPVPEGYDKVYQLGFRSFPNGPLHKFIARAAGLTTVPDPTYKFPDKVFYEEPYVLVAFVASRAWPPMYTAYVELFKTCPIKVVQTGTVVDYVDAPSENQIGLDLLEVLSLLAHAKVFVGFYSAILALANAFPALPKIITLMHGGTGEQHGLHIANTIEIIHSQLPVKPRDKELFQERLLTTVLARVGA